MAAVLKLRHNTTDLNLLSESSFMLDRVRGGYVPGIAGERPGRLPAPLIESIPTFTRVADDDAMAVQEQALNAMVRRASRFVADPMEPYPVWLHMQAAEETNQRRALVRSIAYSPVLSRFDQRNIDGDRHYEHNLVIEREPWWEAIAETTSSINGTSISSIGDANSLGTLGGDVPARLHSLVFTTTTWSNYWIGFRSANKHGTLANFEPIWECEDGANEASASDAADASASGGTRVTVSFSGGADTMMQRLTIKLGDVTANPADNRGRFLVLLRAMVDSGSANVYLAQGVSGAGYRDLVEGPTVTVDDIAGYHIYEMGIFTLPLLDYQRSLSISDANELDLNMFTIWAERASGSGSLYLDCLIFIPVDEYYIRVENDQAPGTVNLSTNPQGQMSKATLETTTPHLYAIDPPIAEGSGIPAGEVYMISHFADPNRRDSVSATVTATLKYYARYRSLRGAG